MKIVEDEVYDNISIEDLVEGKIALWLVLSDLTKIMQNFPRTALAISF